MQIKEDRIGVFVRVRPYQEKQQNTTFILNQTTTEITLKDKQRDKDQDLRFTFDHVFPHQTTQQEVYEKVALPIVDAAFQGINGTVFAYGQTSSGKTFTCVGPDCQESNLKGILPRCVQSIFQRIGNSHNYLQFRIRVSMVQIYMQKINDLLDPLKIDLKIRQNKTKGIYIQDVTEEYVSSPQETIKVFKKGVNNRAVAFTNMNDFSSRSHMAFILTLHQNNLKDGSAKSAKITIVDLAGSEKVSKTMAQGKVLDEAKQINKSLSSLGNVINALIDIKTAHIPYRDSKLTRLLQQSLGGNSKTSLIINISPSSYNASQSISSLRFGFRAKDIKNRPKINKQYTIPELLLLLQKSQKRNQQLQILLRELTASINIKKQNKTAGEFVQNLLDSDNPIMSGIEDMEVSMIPSKRTSLKVVKKCYQSQVESESQEEQPKTMRNKKLQRQQLQKQKQGLQQKLLQIVAQRDEQLSILAQQLNRINNQRVDLVRQLDICRERLELATKEARINTMKFNSEKKENENLLQNYIKENIQNQQKSETIAALHSKIVAFEEKFIKLNEIHNQTAKQNKFFGVSKNLNEQTSRILNEVLGEDEQLQDKQLQRQALQGLQKDKKIEELMTKVKQLETELCTFQHLEETKEDFIKQKIKFISERDRIYKDLENRIQKVLELQERLDQEKQKRKYLEELINLDESDKIRKIQSLERHISSVSQEYYVLKGQQSSWKKSNEKLQKKYGQLTKKILQLESENLQLKVEIENLRMQCIELQAINDNRSELDVEFSEVQETNFRGNIVKVVRSNIFQVE